MSLEIGKLYLYKNKLVVITDGQYESNGSISNFWNFQYINPFFGTVNKKEYSDYNNEHNKFIKIDERLYETEFNLRKMWNKYFIGNYGKSYQIHPRKLK